MRIVLLDHRPEYLTADSPLSLLTMPLATSTVLDHVASRVLDSVSGDLVIVPTFAEAADYAARISASTKTQVATRDARLIRSELKYCEASELVLIVDSAQWPIDPPDFSRLVMMARRFRGAVHLVAVGADSERAREMVVQDREGQVTRIERHYKRVTWPETGSTGICATLAPARALADIAWDSLSGLRNAFVKRGVISRDEAVALDVLNLNSERGLLALNERLLTGATDEQRPSGYEIRDRHVFVGPHCRIQTSARLIGPIVIHAEVQIEAGATVIGPSVIGNGSTIEKNAAVAQSILAPQTLVHAGACVRHCVRSEETEGAAAGEDTPEHAGLPFQSVGGYHSGDIDKLIQGSTPLRDRRVALTIKRTFDFICALSGLLVLSPLLLLVALLIKLDSPGPIFFAHRRERKGGSEFACLKFRTMVVDAHRRQQELAEHNQVDGPQFKIDHDPRVTRIGRILRATNIDELPQLINVLAGHMSLVGPRPSPFRENQICVPWRQARLSVRPGITGLWQVCRTDRNIADFNQWIFYDILYVRHFSNWLDLKIIFATLLSLGGKWNIPSSWIIRTFEKDGPLRHPLPA